MTATLAHWQHAEWRDAAACKHADPAIFFPSPGAHTHMDWGPALAVCSGCPVWVECLDYAFADPDTNEWGMWGGHTPQDRARFRDLLELEGPTLQGVLL